MDKKIINRIKAEAEYLLTTGCTLRQAAQQFNISKSTVHKDMTMRLYLISPQKAEQVQELMTEHIKTRHIKGGETTKLKYRKA